MRDCTIFVDGLSKSFAATGVRVGWGFGPKSIIDKMKSIIGHVGAWAPRAEQIAAARFISDSDATSAYLGNIRNEIYARLTAIHNGFETLKKAGFKVNSIAPQAAMYLTVQFDLKGMKKQNGEVLQSTESITKYLLEEAKIGIVPFSAFGASADSTWYRISVGTCSLSDTEGIIGNLKIALEKLS
jgi:aspartate aminotransferase